MRLSRQLEWMLRRARTSARHQLVGLRNGDHNTLRWYSGKSITPAKLVDDFKGNKWVSTVCVPALADRSSLEAKLTLDNKAPSSRNFLCKTSALKEAFA